MPEAARTAPRVSGGQRELAEEQLSPKSPGLEAPDPAGALSTNPFPSVPSAPEQCSAQPAGCLAADELKGEAQTVPCPSQNHAPCPQRAVDHAAPIPAPCSTTAAGVSPEEGEVIERSPKFMLQDAQRAGRKSMLKYSQLYSRL